MKKLYLINLFVTVIGFFHSNAQGTWTKLTNAAPYGSNGNMLLLSDGTVMSKTSSGGSDGNGSLWVKLTPDSKGSYVNGTWSTTIPAMHNTRLYFSSQVLKNGRVYVAGGEYGNGTNYGETYDPLTNIWTMCPNLNTTISDANSIMLENGKVLQALVVGSLTNTVIYNPVSNTYSNGPSTAGINNESSWVKLKDNSIIMVDRDSRTSERYIQSQNKWISDGNVPVDLFVNSETGAAFLLPDGRTFFIGAPGTTAYYTPSGTTSPGTWQAGPTIPNGYGSPDAAAAMMVNGKIICAFSPIGTASNAYPAPTKFYEFDYLNNAFTLISAPGGASSLNISCYSTQMLDLPDGTVLYTQTGSKNYYIYTPGGTPLASGKPTIGNITAQNSCKSFTITGTLFNGISEGAVYGDDEQMATNYPIIRLTSGTNVYYARTYNWNSTGVQRGTKPDTTQFTLPVGLPNGTYSLVVTANGIASDPVSFTYPCITTGIAETENINYNTMLVYPNPTDNQVTLAFNVTDGGKYLICVLDVLGRTVIEETGEAAQGDNSHLMQLDGIAKGIYTIMLQKGENVFKTKLMVK